MVNSFVFAVSFYLDFLNFRFFVQDYALTIDDFDGIMLEVIVTEHMRSFVCDSETIFLRKYKSVHIKV